MNEAPAQVKVVWVIDPDQGQASCQISLIQDTELLASWSGQVRHRSTGRQDGSLSALYPYVFSASGRRHDQPGPIARIPEREAEFGTAFRSLLGQAAKQEQDYLLLALAQVEGESLPTAGFRPEGEVAE